MRHSSSHKRPKYLQRGVAFVEDESHHETWCNRKFVVLERIVTGVIGALPRLHMANHVYNQCRHGNVKDFHHSVIKRDEVGEKVL
jgi:hypothetical protein